MKKKKTYAMGELALICYVSYSEESHTSFYNCVCLLKMNICTLIRNCMCTITLTVAVLWMLCEK
jgi:hypothetical protein